jgi:hypothetical protein
MIVVFGAFTMGEFVLMKILGFALAVAVLIDVTVIRLALGPALLRLAGRWNWWPAVDVSGSVEPRHEEGFLSSGDDTVSADGVRDPDPILLQDLERLRPSPNRGLSGVHAIDHSRPDGQLL